MVGAVSRTILRYPFCWSLGLFIKPERICYWYHNQKSTMGKSGALDGIQGKRLYNIMSAACGAAFMLYGWDAGEFIADILPVSG